MVNEKRCLKRDATIDSVLDSVLVRELGDINLAKSSHSYPDKIVITNLLSREISRQLKGGYIR
jgi:hypothetical protein